MKDTIRKIGFAVLALTVSLGTVAADEWHFENADRIVAFSDVHGAYGAMVETLQSAKVLDASLNWSGGKTHLVLVGDILDRDVLGASDFTIKPRKGQFVVFDKAAGKLIRSIVLPVPTKWTKGIVLFPTIFGNLMVGPTAEEQDDRDDASVDQAILNDLHCQAIKKLPALAGIPVTATYAGIRSATERPEYRIIKDPDRNWITLGGIRSTGLTAALGIAHHVHDLLLAQGAVFKALVKPSIPQVPNLAEHLSQGGSAEAGGAQFGFGDGEDFVGDDGENVGAAGADAVNGLVVEAEGGDAEGVEDGGDDSRKIGRDFPVTGGGFVGPDLVLIRPFARM